MPPVLSPLFGVKLERGLWCVCEAPAVLGAGPFRVGRWGLLCTWWGSGMSRVGIQSCSPVTGLQSVWAPRAWLGADIGQSSPLPRLSEWS